MAQVIIHVRIFSNGVTEKTGNKGQRLVNFVQEMLFLNVYIKLVMLVVSNSC